MSAVNSLISTLFVILFTMASKVSALSIDFSLSYIRPLNARDLVAEIVA